MEEKTVGAVARELMLKDTHAQDPVELRREMLEDFEANVYECISLGKKDLIGDFFVVVLLKKEHLMQNVLRNYFAFRSTCPTPDWDQTVYRYHSSNDTVEILWVVPSKDACRFFMSNAMTIAKDKRDILRYVLDFEDGTLLRIAKKFNGESEGSIILEDRVNEWTKTSA